MARIFKTPFAAQGDKDTIPTPTQGDGSVSITQGFGFDYQREYEDPLAKDIRREDINGILHDITEAVGDIQLTGVAKWSADAAPYPSGAVVWHNDAAWLSLADNNSVEPVEGANWARQRPATLFVEKSANLSDLANAATARTNLGLGNSATLNVGTTSGTVAAGNDSRITGAAQKSANLSDLTNASTARANIGLGNNAAGRANLGLGNSATLDVGTSANTVAAGNDSRITGAAQKSANLSDLTNAAAARSNLGLGTAATRNVGTASGNVMVVGAFGLGATNAPGEYYDNLDNVFQAGFYRAQGEAVGGGAGNDGGCFVMVGQNDTKQLGWDAPQVLRFRGNDSPTNPEQWSDWFTIHHTGNILAATGQSTDYPMTQKAVTDALSTKANLSNPGSMGIGVGQTWQDVTGSRARGTNYTNTTGRPIMVNIMWPGASGSAPHLSVDGVQVGLVTGGSNAGSVSGIVPAGSVYRVNGKNFSAWSELR